MWNEVTVTLAVTENPPQFVKFTAGHERLAANDSEAELRRVDNEIYKFCEEVVDRRVAHLVRTVQAAEAREAAPPPRRRRRRVPPP